MFGGNRDKKSKKKPNKTEDRIKRDHITVTRNPRLRWVATRVITKQSGRTFKVYANASTRSGAVRKAAGWRGWMQSL